ncbi:MAG: translation initiation factor IF-2 [Candidatus Omnitrophica bacterium]|nr:translation initiation factor IF-2 [Candidatus Omnitrophota bacterium]
MRVSELAKELNITSDVVLKKLKSLKLKAKDGKQELNKAVLIVLRGELVKELKNVLSKPRVPLKEKDETVEKKKTVNKKAAIKKKTTTKKETAKKKDEEKEEKVARKTTKKTTEKASVKKVAEKKAESKEEPVKVKKEEPNVEPVKKFKSKISAEPFIPLKPLSKKKRKPSPRDARTVASPKPEDLSLSPDGAVGSFMEMGAVGSSAREALTSQRDESLIELELKMPVSVKDFSVRIQQKTSIVLKKLLQMGVFANINQNLGSDIVQRLAIEFGYNVTELKTQEEQLIDGHSKDEDDPKLLLTRAPVITFMGHVDHGKTSLLDRIRKSIIVDKEHGGITQHIGAYSVSLAKGKITFLDTPGHEAFTAMRARGAHITDIVVLVVAADEGVKPQTEEAIDHARAANVPIVVALNKIDRRNADVDKVKQELAKHDLNAEDWGGSTIVCGVSAITGEGVDKLLEMILLESEMLELKANPNKRASGIVVEAHLSRGKGAVATLIVQSGTLCHNDIFVVGPYYGKIKAMFDDWEKPITEAGPSKPVEIMGLPGVPEAGEMFYVVESEKQAKQIAYSRREKLDDERLRSQNKITLEDLYSKIQEGTIKELNVILKADVQGSLEALKDSLQKIPSNEVKVKFIHTGVGDVNASDVILANASDAIIIAFHVGVGPRASEELGKHMVDVRKYRIIYDAVNDVRKALEGLLEPKLKKKFLSRIEVRQVFKLSKAGIIAGCFVLKGKVTRKVKVDVVRNGEVVHTGQITTLKRFKDDVREVSEGFECGISVDKYTGYEAGDIFEAYEIETIARTL